jgi:hypothetical protein
MRDVADDSGSIRVVILDPPWENSALYTNFYSFRIIYPVARKISWRFPINIHSTFCSIDYKLERNFATSEFKRQRDQKTNIRVCCPSKESPQTWYFPFKVDCVKKSHQVKWAHRQQRGFLWISQFDSYWTSQWWFCISVCDLTNRVYWQFWFLKDMKSTGSGLPTERTRLCWPLLKKNGRRLSSTSSTANLVRWKKPSWWPARLHIATGYFLLPWLLYCSIPSIVFHLRFRY